MRNQPASNIGPPQATYQIHKNTTEQQRKYRIITPLFGGGAVPQTCDEITVVRGTEIRGHPRFWWGATCAGNLADIEAVKKREDLIWGKANKPKELGPKREETVRIELSVQEEPEPVVPFTIKTYTNRDGEQKNRLESVSATKIHPYAAFPIQPTREDLAQIPPPSTKEISKEGIEFTLTITFPNEYADEVKMALWAWETFGGIGARTRRGFGALQLLEIDGKIPADSNIPPSFRESRQWLVKKLEKLPAIDHGFPYISPHLRFWMVEASDTMSGWESLIEKLAEFRQGTAGRFHSPNYRNKPGRSYWPEAEAVRDLTKSRRSDLPACGHPKKFPRAVFGLPIIFHFIREDQHNKNNPHISKAKDPADATLLSGGGGDRLASPLILKPLGCQNGQVCGLAVILDGYTIPSSLMLKEQNGKLHRVTHQLTAADIHALSSLKLNNKEDVLEAFLDYLVGDSK
jgi:CRISPR-associated protein Cmr1